MCKVKVCLYWISVIMPIFDILKGACLGIKEALSTARLERLKKEENIMNERFKNDNI